MIVNILRGFLKGFEDLEERPWLGLFTFPNKVDMCTGAIPKSNENFITRLAACQNTVDTSVQRMTIFEFKLYLPLH